LKSAVEQWINPAIQAELITAYLTGSGTPVSKDKARAVYDSCLRHPIHRDCDLAWQAGNP
jgi:hypothetical protein